MLGVIGVATADELFADIPPELRIGGLGLPPALPEQDLLREMGALAARNQAPEGGYACFLGAGAYRHFIPSVVGHVIGRAEIYTAYTPYQPEISRGPLQSMFELQSMVCELTGMDVANAGMYEGASALAEACLMACRVSGRSRIALLDTLNPAYAGVVRTYASGPGLAVDVVSDGGLSDEHACLAVQHPNFFGCLEDVWRRGGAAPALGAPPLPPPP